MLFVLIPPIIFIIIFLLFNFAKNLKLIEKNISNNNKNQGYLIGGIAIYATLFISSFITDFDQNIFVILLISSMILITGIVDDIVNLDVSIRLVVQLCAASIIIGLGVVINDLGMIFDNKLLLLKSFSILLTLFSIICLTNAVNYSDGLDGLASSILLVSFTSIYFFIKLDSNNINQENLNVLYILFISLIILLIFNIFPILKNKIFLGDAGSTFLGFFLAVLLIYYTQEPNRFFHPVLCIWAITLPIFDFLNVTLKRILLLKNPFKSDKTHIHYVLQSSNMSNINILLLLTIFNIFLTVFGYIVYYLFGPFVSIIAYVFMFITYFVVTKRLEKIIKNFH